MTVLVAVLGALHPDRDTARTWAEQELLGREYQAERPGLWQLVRRWLADRLSGLRGPGGVDARLGLAVVTVFLLAVVGYALWRAGGVHRGGRAPAAGIFEDAPRTAADHRAAADAAERAGDLATAVLERFRALARALADRDLVSLAPGSTADEVARSAGAGLPALATELPVAARAFDDVRYGGLPATPDQVRHLRELDEAAARTRPAVPAR